jgi:hypothetical protein
MTVSSFNLNFCFFWFNFNDAIKAEMLNTVVYRNADLNFLLSLTYFTIYNFCINSNLKFKRETH